MDNKSEYEKLLEENKKLKNINKLLFLALSTFVWWADWAETLNVSSYLPEGFTRNIWDDNNRYIKELIEELERQNLLWGSEFRFN